MSSTDSATPAASAVIASTPLSSLDSLGEQLRTLKTSIATLEKSFKEASKDVQKSLKEASKNKKVRRERKGDYVPSEGQKAWNAYVATVRTELQKTNTAATYKDAMIEAKRRRAAGDAAAPKQSTASKAPKAAKAKAVAAATPVAATPAPVAAAAPAAPAKATKAPKAKVIKA